MTFAKVPYPGVNNSRVLSYLSKGGRMEMPSDCPSNVYVNMKYISLISAMSHRKRDFVKVT